MRQRAQCGARCLSVNVGELALLIVVARPGVFISTALVRRSFTARVVPTSAGMAAPAATTAASLRKQWCPSEYQRKRNEKKLPHKSPFFDLIFLLIEPIDLDNKRLASRCYHGVAARNVWGIGAGNFGFKQGRAAHASFALSRGTLFGRPRRTRASRYLGSAPERGVTNRSPACEWRGLRLALYVCTVEQTVPTRPVKFEPSQHQDVVQGYFKIILIDVRRMCL